MKEVSWEILQDPMYVGGEIDIHESDKIYRGPIKEVIVERGKIYFRLLWCAYYDVATDEWTASGTATVVIIEIAILSVKKAESNGRLILQSPHMIVGSVFPKDGPKLDPAKVIGLDLNNLPEPEIVEMDGD